ncbi:uncharacterized protein [Leptinotarsa decemlineata]|uniref:uncharacterized protein n=1 Tax=Leptinotarsa decemlineata TaxID=7539 RepID=UPI003D305D52
MKPNNQYKSNRPNQGARGAYQRTESNQNNSQRLGAPAYHRSDNSINRRYQRKRPRNRSPIRSPKIARRSDSFESPTRGRNLSNHKNFRGRGNTQRRMIRPRAQSFTKRETNKPQSDKPQSQKAPSGINMLVVPLQYPVTIMTEEQLDSLQTELLNSIDKIEDGAFRPQFLDCFKRKGTLTIDCFNQESVDWLKNTAPGLTPWEGAQLKVIEPGKISQMVIIPNQYPLTILTPEQLDSLQSHILKLIDIIPGECFMPQFLKCFKLRGTLVLDCNNQESVEWLKDAVKKLVSWDGPELSVLEPKDVPVLNMLSIWIPGTPENPDQVLERLERQNKGLRTKEWHFIDQKIEENGQVINVSVEDSVLEALKNIDFRPFLNFTRIKVKHLGKFRPRVKKEEAKDTSESKEQDGNMEKADAEGVEQSTGAEGEEQGTGTEGEEQNTEADGEEENMKIEDGVNIGGEDQGV